MQVMQVMQVMLKVGRAFRTKWAGGAGQAK